MNLQDEEKNKIIKAVTEYSLPFLEQDAVTSQSLRHIELGDNRAEINLNLGYPLTAEIKQTICDELESRIQQQCGIDHVTVNIKQYITPRAVQPNLKTIPYIKNIIAIASGKGGVGKSTVATNLAHALHYSGASVGLLDADIYGPSQPSLLGIKEKASVNHAKRFQPIERYGLHTMSIGYMTESNDAMIWRGPMVSRALQQLVYQTKWPRLDYLIIDLPPGTGDIQLTLSQRIPVSAAVIVTTPQDIALMDAYKGLSMFQKVSVPVLGVIENMSVYHCPKCGHQDFIFSQDGGEKLAQTHQVELLGKLPLDKIIREYSDRGESIILTQPEHPISQCYLAIAHRLAAKLSLQPKDFSSRFPNIRSHRRVTKTHYEQAFN